MPAALEQHAVEPTEFPERELLQHNIFLYTGQSAQAEIKSPEFTGLRWIRPGALWIMALSARIFENAKEAVVNAQERGWGAALALVLLTFTLTAIARVRAATPAKNGFTSRAAGRW